MTLSSAPLVVVGVALAEELLPDTAGVGDVVLCEVTVDEVTVGGVVVEVAVGEVTVEFDVDGKVRGGRPLQARLNSEAPK